MYSAPCARCNSHLQEAFCTKYEAIFHSENPFCTKYEAIFHSENSFCTKYEAIFRSENSFCTKYEATFHSENSFCTKYEATFHSENALCTKCEIHFPLRKYNRQKLWNSISWCLKLLFEETTGKTIFARSYLFGSTAYYQSTTLFATIRSHVYNVVGTLNYIQIVLDDD